MRLHIANDIHGAAMSAYQQHRDLVLANPLLADDLGVIFKDVVEVIERDPESKLRMLEKNIGKAMDNCKECRIGRKPVSCCYYQMETSFANFIHRQLKPKNASLKGSRCPKGWHQKPKRLIA